MKARLLIGLAALSVAASDASAALLPNAISGVTAIGSAVGDAPDPGDGSQSRVVDGTGLTVGDPLNSATWTHSNAWQAGWQHKGSQSGFLILDLQQVRSDLDDLYIWNVAENGQTARGAKDIEVYYAAAPTVTPVKHTPYDFNSGGWTLASALTLTQATGNNADPLNGTVDLEPATARYVGIRMLNNYGGGDVGLAEAQVTVVPEPGTLGLLGVAVGGLILRRRNRV